MAFLSMTIIMPFTSTIKSISASISISILFFHFTSSYMLVHHLNNNNHNLHHRRPILQGNQSQCALFMGSWVHDYSYPIYQASSCSVIDPDFNCQMYGRPDSDYLKYRWKPANCELPRFDGLEFLEKMKGKTMMFVGDSLGRNQWESLICLTWSSVPRVSTQMIRGYPLSTFKFLDYGVTLSYFKAPYLVDIDAVGGRRVLKLDDISENAKAWSGVDILSFNTGHWWSHSGSAQGPSEWSGGVTTATKSCYGETAPVSASAFSGAYPNEMKVVDAVLREMQSPVYVLDITTLSAMRKDAHPSIYSGDTSTGQKANPDNTPDCTHWCLPGLPDTWNQLFYTALFF